MVKKKTKRKTSAKASVTLSKTVKKSALKTNRTLAIVALILNLIIPGLGSLVGKRFLAGSLQLILTIIGGIIWTYTNYGAPVIILALVWALVTSINMIRTGK